MQAHRTTVQVPPFQPGPVADTIPGAAGTDSNEAGPQLAQALRRHDAPAVRDLLRRDPAAVRWCDALGNTPLHTAIQSRCEPELINTLLAHRADPAITNRDGDTCMHLALSLRPTMPAVVQSLLDQGRWFGKGIGLGAFGMPNRQGMTALELGRDGGVPATGHAAVLPVLESALGEWMDGFRASLLAAVDADDAVAARHLVVTGGWRLDMPLADGMELLPLALKYKAPRLARLVIELAAAAGDRAVLERPNAKLGLTPLMIAVAMDAAVTVTQLLHHGVSANAAGVRGVTALQLAALDGQTAFVRQLLAAGANPDARDEEGISPIMIAASTGRLDIITLLRDAGGNINGRDAQGRTPLMHAHLGDQPAGVIFKTIIAGARTDAVDYLGRTVRDYQFDSQVRLARSGKSACAIL